MATLAVFIGCLLPLLSASGLAQGDPGRWMELHRNAVVVDGHNDILHRVMQGEDVTQRTRTGHSDLVRFAEGGVDVQFFSVWVPDGARRKPHGALAWARAEIDALAAMARRLPSRLRIARTAADIRAAERDGALSAIIALEGGYPLEESIERLHMFHTLGVRCIAPTWSVSTTWASSSEDEARRGRTAGPLGLTPAGRRLVLAMDTLGILIDASHLGSRALADVLDVTHNPVIASHSACRALRDHHRNLTDEQIRAIAATGGVVMVNFFPPYLKALGRHWAVRTRQFNRAIEALGLPREGWSPTALAAADSIIRQAGRAGLATIADLADHIDHVVRLAGAGAAGLGSDFDGIDATPVGIPDIAHLPLLTRELLRRGYSDTDIRSILGGNALRAFTRVCR